MNPHPTVTPRPPAFAAQLPEPASFWIRYLPPRSRAAPWPEAPGPWLDLARGELAGWEAAGAELPVFDPAPLDDVLYLPPVAPGAAAARDRLAAERLAQGTPVLVQLLAGASPPEPPPPGATVVVDLLPALLAGELDALPEGLPALAPGAAAAWPLIPGLSDEPETWRRGVEILAAAGFEAAQAVAPRLSPADRRRLVERLGEDAFEAVFHQAPPAERSFARIAHEAGLAPFLERPLPRPPVTGVDNRRLAALLARVAELSVRLGRPRERAQALFTAAREIDRTPYDLAALAREGNLQVLPWLDETGRELLVEALAGGTPARLAELSGEYLEG